MMQTHPVLLSLRFDAVSAATEAQGTHLRFPSEIEQTALRLRT